MLFWKIIIMVFKCWIRVHNLYLTPYLLKYFTDTAVIFALKYISMKLFMVQHGSRKGSNGNKLLTINIFSYRWCCDICKRALRSGTKEFGLSWISLWYFLRIYNKCIKHNVFLTICRASASFLCSLSRPYRDSSSASSHNWFSIWNLIVPSEVKFTLLKHEL